VYWLNLEESSPTRHQWKYGKYVSLQWIFLQWKHGNWNYAFCFINISQYFIYKYMYIIKLCYLLWVGNSMTNDFLHKKSTHEGFSIEKHIRIIVTLITIYKSILTTYQCIESTKKKLWYHKEKLLTYFWIETFLEQIKC
jgi:hypothetical protein